MTEAQIARNQALLREIQVKLDYLIGATPSGEARNALTEANIALNKASCEPELGGVD